MRLFLAALVSLAAASPAWAITVPEILAKVDANLTYDTRETTLTMTVTKADRVKVYKMHSYGRGTDEGSVEYLEPARDKGTKMYRKAEELWMWLPAVEKVQKISGHMLRDRMMGSDMSYEDMMQAQKWHDLYTGTLVGEEACGTGKCWKIDMKANSTDVSYPRRVILVDQASFVPVKQELYALSGMLLKTWAMSDVQTVGGRQFPMTMTIEDKVQTGSSTKMHFDTITFSVKVPEEVFSQRWLER
jgi:outer membrane lipoprotein-sorting protein